MRRLGELFGVRLNCRQSCFMRDSSLRSNSSNAIPDKYSYSSPSFPAIGPQSLRTVYRTHISRALLDETQTPPHPPPPPPRRAHPPNSSSRKSSPKSLFKLSSWSDAKSRGGSQPSLGTGYRVPSTGSHQPSQRFPRRLRPHQRLANQKRVIPRPAQPRHILRRMNPALRHPHHASRKFLRQAKRRLQIHFKRP